MNKYKAYKEVLRSDGTRASYKSFSLSEKTEFFNEANFGSPCGSTITKDIASIGEILFFFNTNRFGIQEAYIKTNEI